MPFLEGPFAFTGKLDMLSAYRMRGVDGIVIRRKGGPSPEKIKTSPSFENTRHTMSEFGGCSRLGSYVRLAMHAIRQLSDYNFGSDINSIMRQVQLRDDTGEWGRRKITLSEHARILEGFQTTKKAPSFDSIIRTPVYYTMDRANRSARVEIPELLRDINYFPQNNHAMFRLTITLGIVPDLRYDIPEKEYLPAKWYDQACYARSVSTEWNPSLEGMGSTTLELAMEVLPPEDGWTLMLAIGIQYGSFRENGKIDEVKRFGAAKILALRGKDASSGSAGGDGVGEDESGFAEDDVMDTVVPDGNEMAQEEYQEPEVRYVYTLETIAAKQDTATYCYTLSVPDKTILKTFIASATGRSTSASGNPERHPKTASAEAVTGTSIIAAESRQRYNRVQGADTPAWDHSVQCTSIPLKKISLMTVSSYLAPVNLQDFELKGKRAGGRLRRRGRCGRERLSG